MIPFAIPLALKTLPWKWIGIGVGALVLIGMLWWAISATYSAIYDAGAASVQKKWDDAVRAAEAKAAADTALLNEAIAEIDTSVTIDMEAINAVRTVYRDKIRTVAIAADRPDCAIADGLRAQINAAASDYATAAGAGNAAVRPAKPSP